MNSKEYAQNLEEYLKLELNTDAAGLSEDEFVEKLIANSLGKKDILIKNNALIQANLEPYERDFSLVTDQIEKELIDWMYALQNKQTRGWTDRITAERIQLVLYNVYLERGEYDKAAKAIFLLTYFDLMHRVHFVSFSTTPLEKYRSEWAERFDKLSDDGKVNVVRYFFALCFDTSDTKHAYKRFLFAKSFYDRLDEKLRKGPEAYNSLISGILDTISLTCDALDGNKEKYTAEEMAEIRKIYQLHESTKNLESFFSALFVENNRLRMNYHLGLISIDEFLDTTRKRVIEADVASDTHYDFIISGAYYIQYLWNYYNCSEEEKYKKSYEIINAVLDFGNNIKKADDNISLVTNTAEFVKMTAKYLGYTRFKKQVVDITVRADKALYIHTVMVYLISSEIAMEIAKSKPDYFEGVAGFTVKEVIADPNKIKKLTKECAFMHDVGKHCCMDYVSDSSRSLTYREFEAIKMHPENFEEFFSKDDEKDDFYACVKDCALLHHVWHNSEGGYPSREHTVNRPMVDIISIADSIDAATDIIGRPYTSGKTLDDLIAEFDSCRDSRYSAFVIDTLKNPELKKKINRIITKGRRHVNYAVYAQ